MMIDSAFKSILREAFLKALQDNFCGFEEAQKIAVPLREMLQKYSRQTQDAADIFLTEGYRQFHTTPQEKTRYTKSWPCLEFNYWEQSSPRLWIQDLQFVNSNVYNKRSDLEYVVTRLKGVAGYPTLRMKYNLPEQTVSLQTIQLTKAGTVRQDIMTRKLTASPAHASRLLNDIKEEILDWITNYAPKEFLDDIIPCIGRMQSGSDAAPAPKPGN